MADSDPNISDVSTQTHLTSIDVFRGLTVLAMIFVNTLSEGSFKITNISPWMKHAQLPNTMTFVDVVSPFFIFIVGMCIPIAITRRFEKTKSWVQIWAHILIRAVSLMLIGTLMVNRWAFRETARPIGMNADLWGVLLFVSFFLIWNRYPNSQGFKRTLFIALRVGGIVLLTYLVAIFRRGEDMSWFKFGAWGFWSWWVLGIIGWAYLVSCAIYIMFRRHIEGVMGCLGLLILLYIGDCAGVFNRFHFLDGIRHYVPFATLLGSWPSISTAGVVVGMLCTDGSVAQAPRKRITSILVFATGLFIAGFLLRPLLGISSGEGKATPTWALYSSAISCVIYAFLYWLFDVLAKKRWVNFILPIGTNPLLVYLLSRMLHPLFGLLHLEFINNYFNSGITGILRTMLLTILLVLFSRWLTTRCRIVLRL